MGDSRSYAAEQEDEAWRASAGYKDGMRRVALYNPLMGGALKMMAGELSVSDLKHLLRLPEACSETQFPREEDITFLRRLLGPFPTFSSYD